MPALTPEEKKNLGKFINPFERSKTKTIEKNLFDGEKHNDEFTDFIHDGIENNEPPQFVKITVDELTEKKILSGSSYAEKCFLWIIDDVSIKIIWEKTSNVRRYPKQYVCHTNITACGKAYIGGEMYFCEDGNIYVNFMSDRYGWPETDEHKRCAIEYIKKVGYKNVINIEDLIKNDL